MNIYITISVYTCTCMYQQRRSSVRVTSTVLCLTCAFLFFSFSLFLVVVGSNGNSKEIMCVPDNLNPNQEFVWFMNSTNGTSTRLNNSDKYEITRDTMNVKLLINDITLQDLGIYYCQGFVNGEPPSGPLRGNCLRVYSELWILVLVLFANNVLSVIDM